MGLMAVVLLLLANPAAAALKVFACEPEWAALAMELGGSHVDTYSATTALQDPHRIQARPSLIAKFRQADLVICTGAELEAGWLPALVEKANNPKVLPGSPGYFEASRFVQMLEIPAVVDRSMGDVHAYGNPHIQTSPASIATVADALALRLAELDPANAGSYRQRHQQFSTRWSEAMRKWTADARPLVGVAVVSAHKSWPYLYAWLGMREVATLEPKPGVPPSASHLAQVVTNLKSQSARMVIFAAYQDRKSADWLAQRTKLPAVELPYTVGAEGADDLFKLFDVTIVRLLQAAGTSAE
jgi:zinc/manganese transport system substrate-binding protein